MPAVMSILEAATPAYAYAQSAQSAWTVGRHRLDRRLRDDRGEGVISAAIAEVHL
jgi:hypothetical protein